MVGHPSVVGVVEVPGPGVEDVSSLSVRVDEGEVTEEVPEVVTTPAVSWLSV